MRIFSSKYNIISALFAGFAITLSGASVLLISEPADGLEPLTAVPSVEFNLKELSPRGEAGGFAIPASGVSEVRGASAVCNPDGSATFTWRATGAWSYNYHLDNRTRGGYEFFSQPCSSSPMNGDYCGENSSLTSLTVGAGSVSPQDYGFSFWFNGGSYGGAATITCPAPTPTPVCSIRVDDCEITTPGGMCTASAWWTASNVADNQVKVALVWPNGFEDLWSRYSWWYGHAPANYSGPIAGFHTVGAYTAKMYDKSDRLCATDTFNVTNSAFSCPANVPYNETNFAAIKNYCDIINDPDNNDTPPAGMTYPSSMACNAAPGWQPYGPTCTAPSCDCTYIPAPATPLPNLQSTPTNFRAVKGAQLLTNATYDVGESITFIATTWNVGTADVVIPPQHYSRFQYRLVGAPSWTNITPDLVGVPLGVFPNGANGGAWNELATTTFSTAGNYEVRHCVDVTSVVNESSETDNCSLGSDIVAVTIEPVGGTSVIQGFRLRENMTVGFAGVVIRSGSKSDSGDNPYQLTGLAPGPRTVTSAQPTGFLAQYCEQALPARDCTQATHYTTGSSTAVNLAAGETKNIWWRYIPNTFSIDLEVALIGTNVWSTNLATTDAQRHVKLRWNSPEANGGCVEVGTETEFDTGAGNPNIGQTSDTASGIGAVTGEPRTPENTGGTKTYQIRCTKDGFPLQDSVTVTDASALPPTVDLRAKSGLVRSGQIAELGWTTTNATSCTLNGSGVTDLNRSEVTNPYTTGALTATQTFTLTCQNSIGLTGSDSVRVEVTGQWQPL